jgi:hypothetical protein
MRLDPATNSIGTMHNHFFWLAITILTTASTVQAADLWHLPGWQARAVVEIPKPLTEPGVDTAGVKVLCQGRAKPDGRD